MTVMIVKLREAPSNPEVVRLLEEALREAKAGTLQSVALAGLTGEGASMTTFSGNQNAVGCSSMQALLGATLLLQHRLCKSFEDG